MPEPRMADPAVAVSGLVVFRGKRQVLFDVSCSVPAGDPALRARIGYVTQAPSVYADLSVHGQPALLRRAHLRRRPDR